MEMTRIAAEKRQPAGRHANQRSRAKGFLPAVIYGHGEAPEHISLSAHDLDIALAKAAHVVEVPVNGKAQPFLLKDVQYDHLQKKPIHVDLMRVDLKERVKVKVPVELRGHAKGVAEGGQLVMVMPDIEIECGLLEIPHSIRGVIDHLEIGDGLKVKELEFPAGVTAISRPDDLVAAVRHKVAEVVATPAAAAAPVEGAEASKEPEVIGRVAKEQPPAEE